MENDARMYALGEVAHGAGCGSAGMVCLTLGTGVGSGVALGGRILRGPHGTGGIMCGQMTIQRDGRLCTCGNVGCLETLVGTAGVIRSAEEALARAPSSALRDGPLDPRRIFAVATAGDPAAGEGVRRFARDLGAGVVHVIRAYDPDVVVHGGGMARAAVQFLPTPLPPPTRGPTRAGGCASSPRCWGMRRRWSASRSTSATGAWWPERRCAS